MEFKIENEDNYFNILTGDGVIDVQIFYEWPQEQWTTKLSKEEAELLTNKICDVCAVFYEVYKKHTDERLKALKELCGE